jgi:hypothetical protein
LLAMIAFAGNPLLCRAALKQTSIERHSFTFVRIFLKPLPSASFCTCGGRITVICDARIGGNSISTVALFTPDQESLGKSAGKFVLAISVPLK